MLVLEKPTSLVPTDPTYKQATGLWVITTYFNPARYKMRRATYDLFIASLRRSGISCLTIECAFDGAPFELPDSLDVIKVRGAMMWQKERLLNLAASWLPKKAQYIVWADCDILFENLNWAVETARLLETYPIVQVWEKCTRLEQGNVIGAIPNEVTSFGAIAPNNRCLLTNGRYDTHGHTGYGWAMRREIFDRVGLYEHAVTGSADHWMAHAIYDTYGPCVENSVKRDKTQIKHITEWGEKFYALVQGKFVSVPGRIRHLWHGSLENRKYFLRTHDVTNLGYNPYTDIVAETGQPFTWATNIQKTQLVEYFGTYFRSRREDG
jgi:hypothetical protein